jgi:hypothetical protein
LARFADLCFGGSCSDDEAELLIDEITAKFEDINGDFNL